MLVFWRVTVQHPLTALFDGLKFTAQAVKATSLWICCLPLRDKNFKIMLWNGKWRCSILNCTACAFSSATCYNPSCHYQLLVPFLQHTSLFIKETWCVSHDSQKRMVENVDFSEGPATTAGLSLAPLILSHLRLSLTCAYHVSLAPRFLSHLRLVDWCGFTHVHTCNVTRVQSATDWTASVHTLHMSTPVM